MTGLAGESGDHPCSRFLRLDKGLVYLPEDRQVSLVLGTRLSAGTPALNEPSIWQQRKRESAVVERYHALGIKLNHADQTVRTLSGGNQQKVLLALLSGGQSAAAVDRR